MKANQQKIDDMYARLVAMYRDEGVVVKEIYPHKHQSANAFDKFARRQTRSAIGTKPTTIAITKEPWLIRRYSKAIGIECGALLYFHNTPMMGLGYTDVQKSVDSMRVHLHKVVRAAMGEDPDICIVCQDAYKEIQCTRCYTSICKKCFVKTAIRQRDDSESVKCVGCRVETSLYHIIDTRAHDERYATNSYNEAILMGMKKMGTKDTCLTVIDTNQVSVNNMRITCDDGYRNLHKHTDHAS
jgi:hypothetical protein